MIELPWKWPVAVALYSNKVEFPNLEPMNTYLDFIHTI